MATESFATTQLFEGIYKAENIKCVTLGSPIIPMGFINCNGATNPEIFDVAVDSIGNIFISAVGGGK